MIRNYLLIALRNFKRQKLFTLLNMFGLALGLASAILIFLYVSDELRYDSMHPNYKDTYRIGGTWSNSDGRSFDNIESPGYFIKYLKDNRPEITHAIRICNFGYPVSLNYKAKEKIILTEEIRWAEPNFEEVLSFELLKGNKQHMFANFNSMVISETGAGKLFGKEDPIGRVVTAKHFWGTRDREVDAVVTGVYKDYPSNSHFKPEFIININALRTINGEHFSEFMEGSRFGEFTSSFENYITLKHGADIRPVNAVLNKIAAQMLEGDSLALANGWKSSAFTTKLEDLHFDQKNLWEGNTRGDKSYLTIFSVIAVLTMLIACINYMNLATARSVKRAKEVGLRKSLGSNRLAIAKQFFMESFLMTLGSLIIAILLVLFFLHPFNQLAHKTFSIESLTNPVMLTIVGGVVVFMAFISGLYPAFYLSGFQPVQVLKGNVVKGKSAEFFRKGLVTVQYTVALALIICTFIVIKQMGHLKTTKLNEKGGQILSIRFGGIADQSKFAAFKRDVLEDPEIKYVTMGNHLPRLDYFGWIGTTVKFPELSGDKDLQWNQLNVEFDFARTFQLEFVAGRDFQTGNISDSNSMIINEAGVKALNVSLDKVMGATVRDRFDSGHLYRIIGVVKDFPFRSMHQPIEPLLLNPHVHFIDKIAYIQLPVGKFQEKIASIEKKWRAVFFNTGFDYWFLDNEFNRMYLVETRVSSLAKAFAVLAILITVLGVFGLASYTAEQRTKEVGIRKVLGANEQQVIGLFASVFVKIFGVACVLAIPIAWYAAYKWLQDFVYRTTISPWIFAVSLLGLLVITLLTVSYEIWKSAKANPVHSLRTE